MKIVNLGSSFAAGPGIPSRSGPPAARRSDNNYAHLLARALHCEEKLVDLSVSGATLLNILDTPQLQGGHSFAPQIEGLPEDADVVLVLGGGNDMGYISGMISDSWPGWLLLSAVGAVVRMRRLLGGYFRAPLDGAQPGDEKVVLERYGAVLDAVHAKAPKARIIVVEYLTLLGPDVKPGIDVPFGIERIEFHRAIAAKLQKATEKVVADRKEWCEIIHSAELSHRHGLGSEEPWVWGLAVQDLWKGEAWLHPNGKGHDAVGNMLLKRLNESL